VRRVSRRFLSFQAIEEVTLWSAAGFTPLSFFSSRRRSNTLECGGFHAAFLSFQAIEEVTLWSAAGFTPLSFFSSHRRSNTLECGGFHATFFLFKPSKK